MKQPTGIIIVVFAIVAFLTLSQFEVLAWGINYLPRGEFTRVTTEMLLSSLVGKYGGVNTVQCNSLTAVWTGMTEAGVASVSMSLASTLTHAGEDRPGQATTSTCIWKFVSKG